MFIGIDVAKAELVVGVRPPSDGWTVVNDAAGVRDLVGRLQALGPALFVFDATGGYELLCVAVLAAADLPVVVVNPRRCVTSRAQQDSSQRRIGSTRRFLHGSPRWYARRFVPCRRSMRRSWMPCSRDGESCWRCLVRSARGSIKSETREEEPDRAHRVFRARTGPGGYGTRRDDSAVARLACTGRSRSECPRCRADPVADLAR